MIDNFVMSEQQLRQKALNAMLLALEAQAAALHSMDSEHSLGVENAYSIDRLRSQAADLIQSTNAIVQESQTAGILELRDRIRSLATVARRLKAESDAFKSAGQSRAKSRYEHLLMMLGEEGSCSEEEAAAGQCPTSTDVPCNGQKLSVQAGKACLRAEIDEFEAYSLQVHAICNLALEYALNAALKANRSSSV